MSWKTFCASAFLSQMLSICLCGSSFGQVSPADQETATEIMNAEWVKVAQDPEKLVYFIDSKTMKADLDGVYFRLKRETKKKTSYYLIVANCDNYKMATIEELSKYPGDGLIYQEPWEREQLIKSARQAEKGTFIYTIVDYACKNALR